MENLIDIMQLSVEEIDALVQKGCDIMANPAAYAHKCDGKILATLFFEPSTRTRPALMRALASLRDHFPVAASSLSSRSMFSTLLLITSSDRFPYFSILLPPRT